MIAPDTFGSLPLCAADSGTNALSQRPAADQRTKVSGHKPERQKALRCINRYGCDSEQSIRF